MSPELETLDQLCVSDMPVSVIRAIFADDARFVRAIHRMLTEGEVRLLSAEGEKLQAWQWQEVLSDIHADCRLSLTPVGANRIV